MLTCDKCGESWDAAEEAKRPSGQQRELVPISVRLWAPTFSSGGIEAITAEWCRSCAAKAGLCSNADAADDAAGNKKRELSSSERIAELVVEIARCVEELK